MKLYLLTLLLCNMLFINADNKALMQAAQTSKLLELVAQSIKNENIKTNNSSKAIDYILQAKEELDKQCACQSESNIAQFNKNILLDIISQLSAQLSDASLSNSKFRTPINEVTAKKNFEKNLKCNDLLASKLAYEAVYFNKNLFNRIVCDIADVANNYEAPTLASKTGTYLALFSYIFLILSEDQLKEYVGEDNPLGKLLLTCKQKLGTLGAKVEMSQHAPHSNVIYQGGHDKGLTIKKTGLAVPTEDDKSRPIYRCQSLLQQLGIVELSSDALIKLSPTALLAPCITKDLSSGYDTVKKQLQKVSAYAQGKKYEEKEDLKKVNDKLAWDKLVGYEAEKLMLSQAAIYAQFKDLFDLADATTNRGYLIHGPLDVAKHLANGMACNINNVLKACGKKCQVASFSAAKLISDKIKLSDKIKELETKAGSNFVVLIIEDLDHAINHTKAGNLFWSELIDGISGVVNSNKKKFFVVATTSKMDSMLSVLQGPGCLENVINLDLPNEDEREEFIKQQLEKRCIKYDDSLVENMVRGTSNRSFYDIENKIKSSIISFKSSRDVLNTIK